MHTTDRVAVITRTMCGVIARTMCGVLGDLTKGLNSRYYTTTVHLDGKSLSLSAGSDPEVPYRAGKKTRIRLKPTKPATMGTSMGRKNRKKWL